MLAIGVNEIMRLNQEGFTDNEIAIFLGIHRTTVTRTRIKYNIPKANRINRRDKVVHCCKCKKVFVIRRKEKKTTGVYYCDECMDAKLEKLNKLK